MRYPQDRKAQTYQRIVKEASARFRRDGVSATGLQPLMKGLGLTHGGFYAHFKSKDELVQTALQDAVEQVSIAVDKAFSSEQPIAAFIDFYLSEHHRDNADSGCPLPTIAAELGQRRQASATTDYVVNTISKLMAEAMGGGEQAEQKGIVTLSTLVGALMLARSVEDAGLSALILETSRSALKEQARA
ncbi:TetR/AcrR family transcriptional regulator [Pseudomonas sp. nanlin1]|uniref:TetR/AcrR family transcriptional regulator n=1 Tax=Pseudomonas sp. nanlin1 TaxID=3040605 RepID=UPI003890F050